MLFLWFTFFSAHYFNLVIKNTISVIFRDNDGTSTITNDTTSTPKCHRHGKEFTFASFKKRFQIKRFLVLCRKNTPSC